VARKLDLLTVAFFEFPFMLLRNINQKIWKIIITQEISKPVAP
jgi:hypothetical protein